MFDTKRYLTLLGTGTSVGVPVIGCHCDVCSSTDPRNQRMRSGVYVQAPQGGLVIDTAPELRLQLVRERVDFVHAALFTHNHADHIFGLDDLRICAHRLDAPVRLYCEEPVERQIRNAFSYAFTAVEEHAHKFAVPRIEFERIGTEPFTVLGQLVRPIRLIHGTLPILGFRFNDVAFCTDVSSIPPESWPLLEGLDTLVLNALRDEPHPTHFSVSEALEVIAQVKPKRAYLTHVSHSLEYTATNKRLPAGVELAYDGLKIPY